MKVTTMRRLDALIGAPLCLAASCLRAAARLLAGSAVPSGRPRSILIIKLSELGALVLLGPAVRSLTELVGRQNLYFLTFGESRPLLEILGFVPHDNIFTIRTDSLVRMVQDTLGCLSAVRRRRIEGSLDLDFFSRATALIGLLSGCRQRTGCHSYFGEGPYRGDLLTHRVKFNPHIHVSRMFEIMAKAVEQPGGDFPRIEYVPGPAVAPRERFTPTQAEIGAVQRMLDDVGAGPGRKIVLLNSNISDREAIPLRKWSDERYVELARLILAGTPEAVVLLTGGLKEADSIARLEAAVGNRRCRSIAGRTTLRELLALYQRAVVLVTNDSGPAHLATLTDIQVVVLFGPETPLLWRPLGDGVEVVYRGLGCSPCFTVYNGRQSSCRRNACMDIAPAEVYEIVRNRLAPGRGRI